MAFIISETVVLICFISLIIVLFDEKKDYLVYSFLIVVIAGLASAINIAEARDIKYYVDAIHWEVIFFLISMFTIVEILKEALVFHYIAKKMVNKYRDNIRKMFWMVCLISTFSASIIEDLSVAIIFIPIIIETCKEIETNPKPFLLGMTICINIAATLTPFGSAQNIMIATYFNFTLVDFFSYISLYFILTTFITLFLLDKFVLSKQIKEKWAQNCEDKDDVPEMPELLHDLHPDPKTLKRNFIGLGVFLVLLIVIPYLFLSGLIGMLMFVFLNPKTDKDGKKRPNVSKTFTKVDYKLIYFFICLFILVYLMELNGFIDFIQHQLEKVKSGGVFTLCLIVLIISSILSGLIDNAPVTILFLPIIDSLIGTEMDNAIRVPVIIALILGVNLGGNFLPQGSAADMMTLELSDKYCVEDMNYKVLTKIGGLFALLHILIGIAYLALVIYTFPL